MPAFRKQSIDVVVDVRSQIEFWMGHLPGAVCMPVDVVVEQLATRDDVTKDAKILVYCASGARSASAAAALAGAGYRNVINAGGIAAARAEFQS